MRARIAILEAAAGPAEGAAGAPDAPFAEGAPPEHG